MAMNVTHTRGNGSRMRSSVAFTNKTTLRDLDARPRDTDIADTGTTQLTLLSLNIKTCTNKEQHIIDLVKKHKTDFIFLQETNITTEHDANMYTKTLGMKNSHFSLGRFKGVGIVQTSDRWEITHKDRDSEGRMVTMNITDKNDNYTLVNIYAPAKRKEQPLFYQKLITYLKNLFKRGKVILGGDFNYVTSPLDTTNPKRKGKIIEVHTGIEVLQYIMDTYKLVDAYRTIHKKGKETTFKNNIFNSQSRLDRFYTPNTDTINEAKHVPETLTFTDHKGVKITLNTTKTNCIKNHLIGNLIMHS